MSSDGLAKLFEHVCSDKGFSDEIRKDPTATLARFELSTVELFALSCADSDALRRLVDQAAGSIDTDLTIFQQAFLPAFDENEQARYIEVVTSDGNANSGQTTKVTSAGVTKCCWP